MKVLVFTSLYPNNMFPHHGVFIKERMTWFAKVSQCPLKVVAPVPYFPPLKVNPRWRFSQVTSREMIEGIEVHHPRYFMIPKVGMALHGVLMFLSILPTVKKIRATFDFDLIDSHFVYPDGFAAVLLGKFFGKPVVVSARGSDINLYEKYPLIRRLLQQTLGQADKVIAVSQALKCTMMGLGIEADKIAVVSNGVDTDKFFPTSKEESRTKLGFLHKRMLLSVGHLTPVKGFDLLIRMFRSLIDEEQEKNLCLTIVGEGTSRKKLEALVSSLNLNSHVSLVGNISHKELCHWYNAADLFCLASSREGWPNVLLESLACGTPVVAVKVGGIPEIINADHLGIVTERNERALTNSIALALKRPWNSTMIVEHTRKQSWERVSRSVLTVFESALREKTLHI